MNGWSNQTIIYHDDLTTFVIKVHLECKLKTEMETCVNDINIDDANFVLILSVTYLYIFHYLIKYKTFIAYVKMQFACPILILYNILKRVLYP